MPACDPDDLLGIVGQRAFGTGTQGTPALCIANFALTFVAHEADRVRTRPDEHETRPLDLFGEIGVLGQKAIARVDGLSVGDLGCRDDRRHVEVARRGRRGPDAHGLVGQADVLRLAIGLRVHHHRPDA
jgi:hypothetical protein